MTDHTETLKYLLRNLKGLNTGVGTIAACVAAIEEALGLDEESFNHLETPASSQIRKRKQESGMTNEQINRAIAKACGCEHLDNPSDYCQCLNTMHEAEQHIPGDFWMVYIGKLACVTKSEDSVQREFVCATARQRAEAFLRTLGKWEVEK